MKHLILEIFKENNIDMSLQWNLHRREKLPEERQSLFFSVV